MREYTDLQREHTAEDLAHIVDFLATALYTGDAELFTGFITLDRGDPHRTRACPPRACRPRWASWPPSSRTSRARPTSSGRPTRGLRQCSRRTPTAITERAREVSVAR